MRLLLLLSFAAMFFAACTNGDTTVAPHVVRIGTEVGDQAPDFTLADPSGNPLSLSQLRGKVVLLDFWASWCQPCLVQLPDMKEAQAKYRDRGFIILGVSSDYSVTSWKNYLSRSDLDWLHVYDPGDSTGALARYGVTGIPHTWLIDRNGTIVRNGLHSYQLDEAVAAVIDK